RMAAAAQVLREAAQAARLVANLVEEGHRTKAKGPARSGAGPSGQLPVARTLLLFLLRSLLSWLLGCFLHRNILPYIELSCGASATTLLPCIRLRREKVKRKMRLTPERERRARELQRNERPFGIQPGTR